VISAFLVRNASQKSQQEVGKRHFPVPDGASSRFAWPRLSPEDKLSMPIPMSAFVVEELTQWWAASLYKSEDDFIFPSIRKNGEQAISPESILKREIRPALKRIGVTKQVGFHTTCSANSSL
jgi:hypothetical protein